MRDHALMRFKKKIYSLSTNSLFSWYDVTEITMPKYLKIKRMSLDYWKFYINYLHLIVLVLVLFPIMII